MSTGSNATIMPKIAYIIVSWNNKDILDECIASINGQDTTAEKVIYLVDNNSKDKTAEYVAEHYPRVVLLAEKENHGFARGNNIAIKLALKDAKITHLVLLNTDARLAENWTSVVLESANLHKKAATLQSITLDYYDHQVIDSTHIYISRNGQGTQSAWRVPLSSGSEPGQHKVFGCNAAAMMITRAFVEAQPFKDFFDETMFMYLEDVDVATRATVMGWDNYLVPGTRAYHMGSVSSNKKDPSFSLYMTFRNNTGLLVKNLPISILWRVLVRMPGADRAAIRHLKRTGRGKAVPAIIRGRLCSLLYLPIFIGKRRQLRRLRSIDAHTLWYLMDKGF